MESTCPTKSKNYGYADRYASDQWNYSGHTDHSQKYNPTTKKFVNHLKFPITSKLGNSSLGNTRS